MEQTLTSDETLESKISKMTIFDQFAQTIFVEHNHGMIEVESSYRESNTIKFIRTEISYNLKNHRVISKHLHKNSILISDLMDGSTISVDKSICKCVSGDLNKLFIQELNRFQKTEEHTFNLFKQNFFQKLWRPNTEIDLINKFIEISQGMSWAIIPYNLSNIFYKSDKLNLSKEDNQKLIYHLGEMEHIHLYVNPDDVSGKIFFGNFDSMIILANKNMNIYESPQGMNYNFEYLFIEQSPIKSLQVI
jgi:hypothetical protein